MTRIAVALAICVTLVFPAGAFAGWEKPQTVPLPSDGARLSTNAQTVRLAAGSSGTATALFFVDGENKGFLARRPRDATSWGPPREAPLSLAPGFTALAANRAGDTMGVWGPGGSGVLMRGTDWRADAASPNDSTPALPGTAPQVALDAAGNGYLVSRSPNAEVLFARFDAATRTWSAAQLLTPRIGSVGTGPLLAGNGAGEAVVIYSEVDGTGADAKTRLVGRRLLPGQAQFSESKVFLDDPANGLAEFSLAIDDHGTATIVFTAGTTFQQQVYARRWESGAAPSEKIDVISAPREAHFPVARPSAAVDDAGRLTAAWLQTEEGIQRLYSVERTAEGRFSFPERVSGSNEHFSDDEGSAPPTDPSPENERSVNSYDLAVDAEGTATIVYTDSGDGFGFADVDVKAARRATGGRWSDPVSLPSADTGRTVNAAQPRIAAVRPGQVDVVYAENEPRTPDDAAAFRLEGRRLLMATRFEGPPPATNPEHQTLVRSFDGTGILVQWCPAAGLQAGERAPTIIAGSGWGIPGRRCGPGQPEEQAEGVFGTTPIEAFTNAGYNVLTFDARGFWRSGGVAQVDSAASEGKDMQALIDYVARQSGAQLDAPGDPRLGMSGGSYGGGIQFVTAAIDHRVDAIAPSIAWNSLVTSLFPRETVKAGWAAILVGAGVPMTQLPGVLSPAGIQAQQRMAQEVYDATAMAARSGTIDSNLRAWFEKRGPHDLLGQIKAPTLIIQGTTDTMFTLDEAHRNFEALRAAGTEVKMLWFCGGHGACERVGEDQAHVDQRVLGWFDRHLRGGDASTGPLFEWVDEEGAWHESESYPPAPGSEVRGTGSGTLSLTPGELPGSGGVIFATPYSMEGQDHPGAVEVPIETPRAGSALVGAPQLRLVYSATGTSTYGTAVDGAAQQRTYVYAQVVDQGRQRVVGNQATPIPITLDGEEHQISLPLERIASRSSGRGYALQIVPQTSVYDGQRAAGVVDLRSIDIRLPLDEPAAALPVGAPVQTAPRTSQPPGSVGTTRKRTRTCAGRVATIVGTRGSDVITGTRRADVIVALGGGDTIRSRGGRDVICSGTGRDVVSGERGDDLVRGGTGNDRLLGGRGRDVLRGERGRDVLLGGQGRDRLYGGAGRDLLRDGLRDVLRGGLGVDRLVRSR